MSEEPYKSYSICELASLFAGGVTPNTSRCNRVFYFFKRSLVNSKESLKRLDELKTLLSSKGLNVYEYEDYKSIGFIMMNEIIKLKQTLTLKLPNSDDILNNEQNSEYISSRQLNELEDILDQFCLSAFTDKSDTEISMDSILDLYKLEDWSSKLKRSNQRFRHINEHTQRSLSDNRILLLTGQPGVGKTRFLMNWLNKRKLNGFTTLNSGDNKFTTQITIKTPREIDHSSYKLKNESSIIVIEQFIEADKCNSDIWQLLDDLNSKARKARCKGEDFTPNLGTTLSALTSEQEDFERARQLRQLGSRFFASLNPNASYHKGSHPPVVVIIDGMECLEDPLAKTPEGVKCVDWLFSCHEKNAEINLSDYGVIKGSGLPIVPSRTRFILTCSSSHYISHQLTKCPLITTIEYPANLKHKEALLHAKPEPTPIGSLEEASETSKEETEKENAYQSTSLISLFPNLLNNSVYNNYGDAMKVRNQKKSISPISNNTEMIKTRLMNPILMKLYENWCLRHNALARNLFIHELQAILYDANSSSSPKEMSNTDDYIERLLATQSVRQLILCLLHRWSIEFECYIINVEEDMQLSSASSPSSSSLSVTVLGSNIKGDISHNSNNNDEQEDKKSSEAQNIDFKSLTRKAITQLSKDWTIGWVGIVFHTILAASKFTWSKEDMYSHEDESYGFKFQDILYILNHINLSETWVNQCLLPSTVLALQSPLLGFYCLRLFHRAGVFSSKTGGAILRSTNLHGYLKFNHDIIQSVMRQILARDNSATGVQLPLPTTAYKWCKDTTDTTDNTLSSILMKNYPDKSLPTSSQSLASHSLSLIEDNLYKSKPKITFKKIGHKIQAILSLTESGNTGLYRSGEKKSTSLRINNNDYNNDDDDAANDDKDPLLVPVIRGRVVSTFKPTLQMIPDIFQILLKSNELLSSMNSTNQPISVYRAYTRHLILSVEVLNKLIRQSNRCLTHNFISRLISTQIEMLSKVNHLIAVKILLNNIEYILLHPWFLLCYAFPTYETEIFTGSILNAHLLVRFWQFIQQSLQLIHKKSNENTDSVLLSPSCNDTTDITNSVTTTAATIKSTTTGNPNSNNSNISENTSKLNGLAQSALYYLQHKVNAKENTEFLNLPRMSSFGYHFIIFYWTHKCDIRQMELDVAPNMYSNFAQFNELPGENNLESIIWILGELIYFMGNENDSIKILSQLAEHFIQHETLSKADVIQLSYLGLSIVKKLRYLRCEVNDESIDDKIMLYQSLTHEIESKIMEWKKESSTLFDTGECAVVEQRISTALAYLKLYQLESIIGVTKSSNEQLNLFEYQINQSIESVKQFSDQYVDKLLSAMSKYLLAKLRLIQMKMNEYEFLLQQAISECISDQGEYHPQLAEWLMILALSLQNSIDDSESKEAKITFGRRRAQACLRWALDIMTYNQEIRIQPAIHPPMSILSNPKKSIYLQLHRSVLLRLPRYLITPQIQSASSVSISVPTSIKLSSVSLISSISKTLKSNDTFKRKLNQSSEFLNNSLSNYNTAHHNTDIYQTLPAEICLHLAVCLLNERRHIGLQEATTRAAYVLHERILFLGIEHPATIQISRILDHIEHYLTKGQMITKSIDESESSWMESSSVRLKLSTGRLAQNTLPSNRSPTTSYRQISSAQKISNKFAKFPSSTSLLSEKSSRLLSSLSDTTRTNTPSSRLDYRQSRTKDTLKSSKYELSLRHLGKIHRILSRRINRTSNMKSYTENSIYRRQPGHVFSV
ncbi:unnamed protein product [Trichobilharzia szidati]|nr:unnamed protein product [Trichobilharzia szidati]